GPQEMVREGMRFGIWLDAARMREEDLATARDLEKLGASVLLIGQGVPADAVDLVLELPKIAGEWQFLVDCIPAQLAAEQLARMSGVDSDTFRLCSFVVEDEAGLLGRAAGDGAEKLIGAVDIGGTKIAVGIVDRNGRVVGRVEAPTEAERGY